MGYNLAVDGARERARKRVVAFLDASAATTQETFAARCGHKQSWVSKLRERGPRMEDLDAIAAEMKVSVADLVGPEERDLIRHADTVDSPSAKEGPHDAAVAPGVLPSDTARRVAIAGQVQQVIAALTGVVETLADSTPAARRDAPRRARRHRNAS